MRRVNKQAWAMHTSKVNPHHTLGYFLNPFGISKSGNDLKITIEKGLYRG